MQQQDVQTRAALSAESAQVAALQQHQLQLVQNVHAAVQANLIPPHLLTSTPSMSPSVALKLQRMIQLYELFQKLNVQSQMIASGSAGSQDLISALGSVKQQIVQLQQEVVVALASTSTVPPPPLNLQQPPPSIVPQSNELIRGLPAAMTNDELAAASSKLNQWKQQPSSVTSDPSKQPSSLIQPPNGPLSASNSWPTQSSNATAALQGSDKSVADGSSSNAAAAAAAQLDIEEFVPGKPWQGPSVRSVEDDPFITPGSVTRSAISAVDDAHVMNVLGGKSAAGTIGKQTGAKMGSAVWSNDGMGADARGGQPSHASHPQPPIGRSVSWACWRSNNV
jgi:trinucleotide repeat-containing gene 6 protein